MALAKQAMGSTFIFEITVATLLDKYHYAKNSCIVPGKPSALTSGRFRRPLRA
jgi:hypothetical protein